MRAVFCFAFVCAALGAVSLLDGCGVDSYLQCGDTCGHPDGSSLSDDGGGDAPDAGAGDDGSSGADAFMGTDAADASSQCNPGVACQVQPEGPATCCGGLTCTAATTCQPSCKPANAGCMQAVDCCFGLRCSGSFCVCTPTGMGCNEDFECCSLQCSSHICG